MTTPKRADPKPESGEAKKPYQKPRLTDYGPVSKLTQTGTGTQSDGMKKRPCL
jgi:hypothetical protein